METETKWSLRWDVCDLVENQVKYLVEEEGISEEEAQTAVNNDADFFSLEWEFFLDGLQELLNRVNPNKHGWFVQVKNFGWRERSGHKYFRAETAAEFLNNILPETDCTFNIFLEARSPELMKVWPKENQHEIRIQNFHHDSPYGKEWYYVEVIRPPEEGDVVFLYDWEKKAIGEAHVTVSECTDELDCGEFRIIDQDGEERDVVGHPDNDTQERRAWKEV